MVSAIPSRGRENSAADPLAKPTSDSAAENPRLEPPPVVAGSAV